MKNLLQLYALLRSFEELKDIMIYDKEDIVTLKEVRSTLRTNKLTKFKDIKIDHNGKVLNV